MKTKNRDIDSITIGIIANVDAGKTTLSESILSTFGLKEGGTQLDTDDMEKRRGITIFSSQAVFQHENRLFYLIDTPGHRDFSGETGKILQILDCAVLVISGTEGVSGIDLRLWNFLESRNIPVFIFINKRDLPSFREDSIEQIEGMLSQDSVLFPENDCDLPTFYEKVALTDEAALEEYLENGSIKDDTIRHLVSSRKLFPVFQGSALENTGIDRMLTAISRFTKKAKVYQEFAARVFKISRDEKGRRLTHLKVTGGSLKTKDSLEGEKVEEIRVYQGAQYDILDQVTQGTVCTVVGPENTYAGQGIGIESQKSFSGYGGSLIYFCRSKGEDRFTFIRAMRDLAQQYPEMHIHENRDGSSVSLSFRGQVQKETLREILRTRYGVEVVFEKVYLPLRETVKKAAFDRAYPDFPESIPYFDVAVRPGKGLSAVVRLREEQMQESMQISLQNTLLQALKYGEISGLLTSSLLSNLEIIVSGGRGKLRHKYAGDLFESVFLALTRAMIKAGPQVLHPFAAYQVQVREEDTGRITALLTSKGAIADRHQSIGRNTVIEGMIPLTEAYDFDEKIMEITSGTGYFTIWDQIEYMALPGKNPSVSADDFSWAYSDVPAKPERTEREGSSIVAGKDELKTIFEMTYGKKKERGREERVIRARGREDNYKGSNQGINRREPSVLYVDGYNIIFSWDELHALSKKDLGASRDHLVEIMANYAGYTGEEIVVVFDAYKQKGRTNTIEMIHGIKVVYTGEGETADHFIEKTVHENIDKRPITVATSDRLEQMNVFGKGAMRLSARDLEKKVRQVTGRSYIF